MIVKPNAEKPEPEQGKETKSKNDLKSLPNAGAAERTGLISGRS